MLNIHIKSGRDRYYMRSLPTQKLDPRIKSVWRISDCLWIVILSLCCIVPFALVCLFEPGETWALGVTTIAVVLAVVLLVLFVVVLPPIRYARWRYEVTSDYLEISRGIIWRKRFMIPFIRVQNTDTKQGPILRMFGLASVTVSTAAGSHEIPGLDVEEADVLRDKAAELARIAKEDV